VPGGAIPAPDTPVPVTAESLALGADLYAQNCSRCHGAEGQGTQRAPALNVKGYLAETNDTALQQIITLGVPGTAMPSWGDRLSTANIQAIVGFIRAWEPTAPEVAEPARSGGGPWWRSGGSSTSGGKGGGPPWQRDSSATSPEVLYLPAEGNTTVSVPSKVPASGSALAETGADTQQVPDPALPHSAGGPPEWAGAGQQNTAALSPGETRAGLQPAWWEKPDWRIIALLLVGLMFSISLIGIAAFHLAHLKSSGYKDGPNPDT
jgi:cytochrome c553